MFPHVSPAHTTYYYTSVLLILSPLLYFLLTFLAPFIDDIDIVAENYTPLKYIMVRIETIMGNEYNVKKNKAKRKIMICGK